MNNDTKILGAAAEMVPMSEVEMLTRLAELDISTGATAVFTPSEWIWLDQPDQGVEEEEQS